MIGTYLRRFIVLVALLIASGTYYWGGLFYTSFVLDPKEDLIAIFNGTTPSNRRSQYGSKDHSVDLPSY